MERARTQEHGRPTPGTWRRVGYRVAAGDNVVVAECFPDNGGAVVKPADELEAVANADRCAASDAMLEALEELVAEFDEEDRQARQEPGCLGLTPSAGIELARLAIRKARGEITP